MTPRPARNAILGFLRKVTGQSLPPPPSIPPLRRTMHQLHVVAEDTISRTPEIIAATTGASTDSTFHARQLPPLSKDNCPNFPPFTVRIEGLDAFTTARKYIQQDPTIRGKVAVLNLASDQYRGGGWRETLCKTQVRRILSQPTMSFRIIKYTSNSPFPMTIGRSTVLLFHPIYHPQERILPLAKPGTRFRCGHLLPSGRNLQRRPGSHLR